MENKLFRSKSIDRISSPEELNDYVRVSNPGVWMTLMAVIVLLIGVCIWGVFGKMNTTVDTVVVVEKGNAICFIKEADVVHVEAGQVVRIKDNEYNLKDVPAIPVPVSNDLDAYAIHVGNLSVGEWVYEIKVDVDLTDGIYNGTVITKSVSPMSLLMN